MDFADKALLAFQVSRIELSPGLLSNSDPVNDGELLPVDGVGVEGPVVGDGQPLVRLHDAKFASSMDCVLRS